MLNIWIGDYGFLMIFKVATFGICFKVHLILVEIMYSLYKFVYFELYWRIFMFCVLLPSVYLYFFFFLIMERFQNVDMSITRKLWQMQFRSCGRSLKSSLICKYHWTSAIWYAYSDAWTLIFTEWLTFLHH